MRGDDALRATATARSGSRDAVRAEQVVHREAELGQDPLDPGLDHEAGPARHRQLAVHAERVVHRRREGEVAQLAGPGDVGHRRQHGALDHRTQQHVGREALGFGCRDRRRGRRWCTSHRRAGSRSHCRRARAGRVPAHPRASRASRRRPPRRRGPRPGGASSAASGTSGCLDRRGLCERAHHDGCGELLERRHAGIEADDAERRQQLGERARVGTADASHPADSAAPARPGSRRRSRRRAGRP